MKHLLLLFCLFYSIAAFSQVDGICYVTSVKGDVVNTNKATIKAGDTISYNRIHQLRAKSGEGIVTFYHPKAGSFRACTKNFESDEHAESLFDFAAHLLKVKGKSVPLSSRGDCGCVFLYECIKSDPGINENVLLLDTLFFPPENDAVTSDSSYYFLQLKSKGRIYNNRLRKDGTNIFITPFDLSFNGETYAGDSTGSLLLGKCNWFGGKRICTMISSVRLNIVSATLLLNYYQVLHQVMKGYSPREIYETYYRDIYVFYGKPIQCQLKKLIGYND
jgi:hypothetical protein